MPKIVIDASIVVKWFLSDKENGVKEATQIYSLLQKNKIDVYAPSFLLIELANVLLQKKHLSAQVVAQVMQKLQTSGIHFIDFEVNETQDLVSLAFEHTLTSYDCLYLLLATHKKIPLLTTDKQLLKVQNSSISLEEFEVG